MPEIDFALSDAGLLIGLVVGLTGVGGGALMTPVLVLFFGVPPLAAVSSDLVVSLLMKPVGAAVHLRRGTVNRPLVAWLVLGSVPSAFLGVLVLKALGDGDLVQEVVKLALGIALLVASTTIIVKSYLQMRGFARARRIRLAGGTVLPPKPLVVRPIPTLLIGVVGGFVVGMTSVGSGSLIIALLLYPTIRSSEVIGTDLVQAVPLVGTAARAPVGRRGALRRHGVPARGRHPGGVPRGARLLPSSSRAHHGQVPAGRLHQHLTAVERHRDRQDRADRQQEPQRHQQHQHHHRRIRRLRRLRRHQLVPHALAGGPFRAVSRHC